MAIQTISRNGKAVVAIKIKRKATLKIPASAMKAATSSDPKEAVKAKLEVILKYQADFGPGKNEKQPEKKRKRRPLYGLDYYYDDIDDDEGYDPGLARKRMKMCQLQQRERYVATQEAEEVHVAEDSEPYEEAEEDKQVPATPPSKKHKRNKSKDEREDARRSPATLKLLIELEDWYNTSSDEEGGGGLEWS